MTMEHLWTDEAHFPLQGYIFKQQNCKTWANENEFVNLSVQI